jgi:hypothetical protein
MLEQTYYSNEGRAVLWGKESRTLIAAGRDTETNEAYEIVLSLTGQGLDVAERRGGDIFLLSADNPKRQKVINALGPHGDAPSAMRRLYEGN